MSNLPDSVWKELISIRDSTKEDLKLLIEESDMDIEINEIDLDRSLINLPKLQSKWSARLTNETILLKDLYAFKESVKLERWKYYSGKQTDKYIADNGILHEKILKSDVDKYLSADEKINLVNQIVSVQKEKVDYIERLLKELGNRGFHIKSIIDWRKFVSGA